jgi:hypothetical protein
MNGNCRQITINYKLEARKFLTIIYSKQSMPTESLKYMFEGGVFRIKGNKKQ